MLEFFIALFGGAYYGVKYLNEKETSRQCKKRDAEFWNIQNQIKLPFSEHRYDPPKTYEEFWIMADSISDDLKYIFGNEWRTEINFPLIYNYSSICSECEYRGMFSHWVQIVYEVWLAKKGFLRQLRSGFNIASIHGVSNEQNRGFALRACEMIEKNLQAAHPNLQLRLRLKNGTPYNLEWEHRVLSYNGVLGRRLW